MKAILWSVLIIVVFSSCWAGDYTPKPRGYFRISLPPKEYQTSNLPCPFTFEYPKYAFVEGDNGGKAECWYNLTFEPFNARLHLTYYDFSSKAEFEDLAEDARTFAFKHTVKASAIDQRFFRDPKRRVYGVYYSIQGNAASSVQFFLTDSAKHYFRGALYFNERPQYDSIQPVLNFIEADINRLIETFQWKN